jgi:ATP-dependent helicase HrpB
MTRYPENLRDLPIYPHLEGIADALLSSPSRFLVLTAETAAGKSTAVPFAFLDRVPGSIVMLEPRRLATVAIAERIADLLDERVGETAGYRLHLDSKISSATKIEIITEAILTRRIQNDPSLAGISVVIIDEFHERSVHADLALALLREIVSLRDDLFVMVMSATIDAEKVSAYLGAPVVSVPGRRFPVTVEYTPAESASRQTPIADRMARAIWRELSRAETQGEKVGSGSILAFLPGISEIRRCMQQLDGCGAETLMLHSSVSGEEQHRVLENPSGERRVVVSSSIAETSITVPGVTTVIDSGLSRIGSYHVATGMSRLVTETESVFSASQRAGRAGRTAPGRCVRLWAESDVRVTETPPEILRSDLVPLTLECALWGALKPEDLAWLDAPADSAWNQARDVLRSLGALDRDGRVTARGRAIASLGAHPRIAAVALSGNIEAAVAYSGYGDNPREAARMKADLERRVAAALRAYPDAADSMNDRDAQKKSAIALLSGFPDRLARHVSDGLYKFPSGRVASLPKLDRSSTARFPAWIVAPDVDAGDREGRIYQYEPIDDADAERWLAPRTTLETRIEFAGGTYAPGAKLQKTEVRSYGKITLGERRLEPGPGDAAAAVVTAVRKNGLGILPWSDASTNFLARTRFRETARVAGKNNGGLESSDQKLLESLEDWLVPFLPPDGQLTEEALLDALRWKLDGSAVDRDVPQKIALSNGVSRTLVFEELVPGDGPEAILEIRIQELFGCAETPKVMGKPVLLRLLSPARRPLQITRDLASFWKNTWPEVRKEMKGRYPKHKWPEDPFKPFDPGPRK